MHYLERSSGLHQRGRIVSLDRAFDFLVRLLFHGGSRIKLSAPQPAKTLRVEYMRMKTLASTESVLSVTSRITFGKFVCGEHSESRLSRRRMRGKLNPYRRNYTTSFNRLQAFVNHAMERRTSV
jgi:hypothetical protein